MIKEKSAGAIVFRKDDERKYLILHYGAGHWEFVKGHIEKDEEEEQTVIRELGEETGIKKAEFVPEFRKEINYYNKKKTGETVFKTVVFFLLESKESKVTLSKEHIGYRWVGIDTALKTLTFDNSKQVIAEADKFIKNL
ncbi:NUDIX domain-containing protein [Candidatus Woesearchaeota archaeon]|nr:NUDIX domain-containing protein [Candidatus Woesearchaeota archaeon]